MDDSVDYTDLVEKARLGDEDSMNRLVSLGEESLRRYVFRLTLDEALTQDIVQEVMLEMFKVLGKLKRADRFRGWLHGIAFNRIRRHYGDKWCGKTAPMPDEKYLTPSGDGNEGLANLVNEELKGIIFAAMNHLAPRQRAVLTMRCYDEMSYSEIAGTMGCSEFSVRALFFRAKRAMGKQLSRRGLGRGSLLTALVLFGKMTAVSEAAAGQVAVTAATVKVGVAAGVAGSVTGKAVVVSLAAAGVITAGAIVATPGGNGGPIGAEVVGSGPGMVAAESIDADAHECWYYYPDGSGGPVMMRSLLLGYDGVERYCQWLQNDVGNYYYDHHSNTIILNNHRMWESDYSVRRLPTDSPELSEFISEVEGRFVVRDNIVSRGRDLLVIARSEGEDGSSGSWTTRHYNVLEEDYFQGDWPRGAKMIDNRNAMHKRGWTYFTVEGRLGGEAVRGYGRLPLFYRAGERGKAWLRLFVGDYEIRGDVRGLCVRDSEGEEVKSYSGRNEGGVFAGLSRPWMGLHTIDTVRRDAALKRVRFEITVDGQKAAVVLDCGDLRLKYTIDMMEDVVEEILFVSPNGREVGDLRFSYVEEFDRMVDIRWRGGVSVGPESEESGGMMWLVKLAAGELVL